MGTFTKQAKFFIAWAGLHTAAVRAAVEYIELAGDNELTTEDNRTNIIHTDLVSTRLTFSSKSNSLDADGTVGLRDDSTNVSGSVITVSAGVPAFYDSGEYSTFIAAGSKINAFYDITGTASGSFNIISAFAEFYT